VLLSKRALPPLCEIRGHSVTAVPDRLQRAKIWCEVNFYDFPDILASVTAHATI